ncbi:hypothetical protein Tco_1161930 [Tanacetum coccineum]
MLACITTSGQNGAELNKNWTDTRNWTVDTFQADKLMEIYKVTMFSMYCERKFEIEPVEVIYYDQKSHISPELCPYDMKVSLADINRTTGLSLEANEINFNNGREVLALHGFKSIRMCVRYSRLTSEMMD